MSFETLIQPEELLALMGSEDLVTIDCRFDLAAPDSGRKRYIEQHLAGAVYADLDQDMSGPPLTDQGRHPLPSPARMRQVFGRLGIDSTKQVVVYDDRGGVPAARLWWMLKYMGHSAVALLDGGWEAWLELVEQRRSEGEEQSLLHSGEQSNPPTQFSGQPFESWLVVLDQVPQQRCLIDSRGQQRYSGEQEPLDPVAGHIPGAVNHHYAANLGADKKMKSPDELRQTFEALFADSSPEEATFYCGSGVSACVNLLAAVHAGFPMSKLYVGSWSEWCQHAK